MSCSVSESHTEDTYLHVFRRLNFIEIVLVNISQAQGNRTLFFFSQARSSSYFYMYDLIGDPDFQKNYDHFINAYLNANVERINLTKFDKAAFLALGLSPKLAEIFASLFSNSINDSILDNGGIKKTLTIDSLVKFFDQIHLLNPIKIKNFENYDYDLEANGPHIIYSQIKGSFRWFQHRDEIRNKRLHEKKKDNGLGFSAFDDDEYWGWGDPSLHDGRF